MSKVIINNVELELNLMDADVVERYDDLLEKIREDIQDNQNYEGKSTADGMRFQCSCVNRFFDDLFGEGTSDRIFPKNNDLGVRMDAFGMITSVSGETRKEMEMITDKYVGRAANRAERRYQKKHGKKNRNPNPAASSIG